MSEWKEMSLTDISSDISYGYTESAQSEKIGPKFLRITDIANGRLNWDTVPYCPISPVDFIKYKLNPGDIVVARTGATTGANYTIKNNDPTEAVFASYLIRYRIDQSYADPSFIGQVLRSITWQDYVDSIAGGSAQPGANAKQLGSFPILLPPLPEQRAIASVLSILDDKIDLLHRQNKTLEAMAETLFRQWFVEEADEGWEEGTIYNFFDVIYGFPFKSSLFNEEQRGLPLIRIRDLKDGHSNIYTDEECDPKYILARGDLVIGMDGEFRIYIWSGDRSVLNQRACKFVPKHEYISKLFIFNLMKEHLHFFENTKGGTTVIHLGKADLDSITVKVPPKELLSQYKERVEDSFKKMINNYSQIRTLEKLRDTLLPKLMSGEVRVAVK